MGLTHPKLPPPVGDAGSRSVLDKHSRPKDQTKTEKETSWAEKEALETAERARLRHNLRQMRAGRLMERVKRGNRPPGGGDPDDEKDDGWAGIGIGPIIRMKVTRKTRTRSSINLQGRLKGR